MAGEPLSLDQALRRLQSPFALEEFSPLTGQVALVVELDRAPRGFSPAARAQFEDILAQLPCPTIGVAARSPSDPNRDLCERFDLIVEPGGELMDALERIERNPLASMATVQLLRHSEGLTIHEGLVAESLVYSTLQSGPEFAAWLASYKRRERRADNPEPAVLVEREGDVVRVAFNRPEKRNAFSAEMRDALVEALQVAVCDAELNVVLTGEGPAFCSGGDLDEFGTLPDPCTAHAIRSTRNAGRVLASIAPRVRAEVHGACVGAGIELPAFAAEVVARRDAFFQLPEVSLGLVPGAGGTVSLPRRIGRQRTAYMALTGRRVDCDTALDWGLIDAVV